MLIASVNGVRFVSTRRKTSRQTKRRPAFRSIAPGRSPASQRIWKPLQMPSTAPPCRRERGHGLHHGREARHRAAPQVVAVGEAARQDHEVGIAERRARRGGPSSRPRRITFRAATAASSSQLLPGKTTTVTRGAAAPSPGGSGRAPRPRAHLEVLDDGVREELLRHLRAGLAGRRRVVPCRSRGGRASRPARRRRPRSRGGGARRRSPSPADRGLRA